MSLDSREGGIPELPLYDRLPVVAVVPHRFNCRRTPYTGLWTTRAFFASGHYSVLRCLVATANVIRTMQAASREPVPTTLFRKLL